MVLPTSTAADARAAEKEHQQLKATIHAKLVEMIDVSTLGHWKPERLQKEVREVEVLVGEVVVGIGARRTHGSADAVDRLVEQGPHLGASRFRCGPGPSRQCG